MLGKALTLLGLVVAVVLAVAFRLRGEDAEMAVGMMWGIGGGTVAALSAIGGAFWAESRKLKLNQALAIVVMGMLFRMLFLGAFMLAAIKLALVNPMAFILGFAAVYVAGQALEVWMLARLTKGRAS